MSLIRKFRMTINQVIAVDKLAWVGWLAALLKSLRHCGIRHKLTPAQSLNFGFSRLLNGCFDSQKNTF
jgi:hypothetical protein